MRHLGFCSVTILVCAFPALAEIVQTTDGRSLNLKDDGTYVFLENDKLSDGTFVEHQNHYFSNHESEYGQKRIRFMPIFKNVTKKKILGVKFTARFLNAFGEEIFKFSGDTDEAVLPGMTSTSNLFYYFEDNQFIPGEPYDKLLAMVTNKSGSVDVVLDSIAFEGGEIVRLSN